MKKILVSFAGTVLLFILLLGSAKAASILFGTGTNEGGWIKATSDTSVVATPDDDYGGVAFDDAIGTTFSSLTNLSTAYNVTDDDCGGGSPRFYIRMDVDGNNTADGNIFIYMGPLPNFTGCTPNAWVNTGELIGSIDARFDLTQLGGPFYGTYADALSLAGGGVIMRIGIVVDGGWAMGDKEQTVLFDNTAINGNTYDFTPLLVPSTKEQCKDGGWMSFNSPAFKNQGDCVSFVQSNENAVGNKTK